MRTIQVPSIRITQNNFGSKFRWGFHLGYPLNDDYRYNLCNVMSSWIDGISSSLYIKRGYVLFLKEGHSFSHFDSLFFLSLSFSLDWFHLFPNLYPIYNVIHLIRNWQALSPSNDDSRGIILILNSLFCYKHKLEKKRITSGQLASSWPLID